MQAAIKAILTKQEISISSEDCTGWRVISLVSPPLISYLVYFTEKPCKQTVESINYACSIDRGSLILILSHRVRFMKVIEFNEKMRKMFLYTHVALASYWVCIFGVRDPRSLDVSSNPRHRLPLYLPLQKALADPEEFEGLEDSDSRVDSLTMELAHKRCHRQHTRPFGKIKTVL